METIRVPVRCKKNLEKRFNIKNFKTNVVTFENFENCILCLEYRQGISCTNCPFDKLYEPPYAGCTKFLHQVKSDLNLACYIKLSKAAVFTDNLKEFEKIIEYARKFIEFY